MKAHSIYLRRENKGDLQHMFSFPTLLAWAAVWQLLKLFSEFLYGMGWSGKFPERQATSSNWTWACVIKSVYSPEMAKGVLRNESWPNHVPGSTQEALSWAPLRLWTTNTPAWTQYLLSEEPRWELGEHQSVLVCRWLVGKERQQAHSGTPESSLAPGFLTARQAGSSPKAQTLSVVKFTILKALHLGGV